MLNVPYWGWVALAIGGLFCLVGGFVAGLRALWARQEKRDGLRG